MKGICQSSLLFLWSVFLFSCQGRDTGQVVAHLEDLVIDTLFLEKNLTTKELGSNLYYFKKADGIEVLRTYVGGTFYEYTYPEGKILRTQTYEQEGPNGIGSFIQGHLIEENFIWFVSNLNLVQADFSGKVIARYNLPEASEQRQSVNYSTIMGAQMYRSGELLLIPDVPFVLNESVIAYQNWILEYAPKRNSFDHISFTFPENYYQLLNDPNFTRYRNVYRPDTKEMIISLPASDSILVLAENTVRKFYSGVDEKMEYLKGEPKKEGEWIVFNSDHNTSLFTGFFYAEKEKIYLRTASIPTTSETPREDEANPLIKTVVLSEDFEKLGEILFPFNTGGFNTPDGFYISIGYPRTEDEVGFVRLDFSIFKQ